jgi:hypothetical protein
MTELAHHSSLYLSHCDEERLGFVKRFIVFKKQTTDHNGPGAASWVHRVVLRLPEGKRIS